MSSARSFQPPMAASTSSPTRSLQPLVHEAA
jgi:hypothetical protein